MALPRWLIALEQIGPIVLAFTPLAPIAPAVVAAIQLAEHIPGATGPEKKALVLNIVGVAAQGANAQAGKVVIDPAATAAIAGSVVDSVVGVVNIVHQLPEAPAPTGPVAPVPVG